MMLGCSEPMSERRGPADTSSRLLVTKQVTGWHKKSELGKYLVPGLVQDMEPTALTQLMAHGLHN